MGGWEVGIATQTAISPSQRLELHLPSPIAIDEELLAAAYSTLVERPAACELTAGRLRVAIGWLLKSWQNTPSITWEDRLVFIKVATKALTGEDNNFKSAERLSAIFEGALTQEGEGLGIEQLLWSPGEPQCIRRWNGKEKTLDVTQIVHRCCALGDARNSVVHGQGWYLPCVR
jgi:hypothetical protein